MAMQTTATTGLQSAFQAYFIRQLLEIAIPATVLDQFAQKAQLPKNMGATSVRFFQPPAPDATKVLALTEGVAPTQYRETTLTPIDVPLAQFGEVAKVSDILTWTGVFNFLKMTIQLMGADCALQVDTRIRTMLVAAGQTPYVTGQTTVLKRYAQGAASWSALAAAPVSAARLVANDLLDAATRLRKNRAPSKGGFYVGILPPDMSRDLMDDDKWVKLAQYSNKDALMKGEVGSIYGVRVVDTTNAQVENGANAGTEGTFDASGTSANSIYTGLVTGTNAYGMVELSGQGPKGAKIIVNDKPDKSDPLNQFILAGWKAYWASCILNPNWAILLRSKSAFVQ